MNNEGSQFLPGQKSIAELFRDNGYNTAIYGKWHLGGGIPRNKGGGKERRDIDSFYRFTKFALSHKRNDWTRPLKKGPWDIGFSQSYITLGGLQSSPYAFLRNSTFEPEVLDNLKFWNEGNYSMPHGISKIDSAGEGSSDWDSSAFNMILVNQTRKFLDDHVNNNQDQPFFAYVALGAVHIPHSPPDYYLDGSKIAGVYNTGHMDLLGEMDKVVGSLIKMLEDKNLIEDTIILFASDNGGLGQRHGSGESSQNSSGPLRGAKGSIYEGGHRIPMIFRWDNGMIPKGESRDRLIGLNDVYATLCNLTGIKVPHSQAIDSVSFADYTLDKNNYHSIRESVGTWKYDGKNNLQNSSIRKGGMKLIYYHDSGKVKLFDLSKDLSESNEISSKNPTLVKELMEEMKQISPCYDEVGEFKVLGANKRLEWRNCGWFRSNRGRLCKIHPEGRLHCGLTCAMLQEATCKNIRKSM